MAPYNTLNLYTWLTSNLPWNGKSKKETSNLKVIVLDQFYLSQYIKIKYQFKIKKFKRGACIKEDHKGKQLKIYSSVSAA